MKSNHKGRQTKASFLTFGSRSSLSEAKEMSHHIQSHMLLYTKNRATRACVIEKNAFAACMILTVSCI